MSNEDFYKFKEEINRQSEQIERDGSSPERLCVHVQRINSHMRVSEYELCQMHKEQVNMAARLSVVESNLAHGTSTLKDTNRMLHKLYSAILGDEEFEHEGLLKMVKRHNRIITENVTKNSVFKTWVFPVVIAVITAIMTTFALKIFP